jgi:hypothetical protein
MSQILVQIPGRTPDGRDLYRPFVLQTDGSVLPIGSVGNLTANEADAFEIIDPKRWTVTAAPSALVFADGDTFGASYLVIVMSPFDPGAETVIEQMGWFRPDVRVDAHLHISQRNPAQTGVVEIVSADDVDEQPLVPVYEPRTGVTASQAAGVLTLTFPTPHGLSISERIEFIVDSGGDTRVSYPDLSVATTPSETVVTCTHQQGAALPSLTASGTGTVRKRPPMNRARNGIALEFGPGSATQASVYVRAEAGDVFPTGLAGQAHVVTVGSSASVQSAAGVGRRSFKATTRYSILYSRQRVSIDDRGIDSGGGIANRVNRDSVIPNPKRRYRNRIRTRSSFAMTRPVARIVSIAKGAGSNVATVTTDVAHALTTASVIAISGVRNQTDFATSGSLTPASIVNATSFTVTFGSTPAGAVTSNGGSVWLQNGGVSATAMGNIAQSVQSVARTGNLLTLVGSAAWSGLVQGDTVFPHGIRADGTGADLGFNLESGAYRVHDVATTNLVLAIMDPAAMRSGTPAAPTGGDFAAVNSGGSIIKATELRLDRIRWSPWNPMVTEPHTPGSGQAADSAGVVVNNAPGLGASTSLIGDVVLLRSTTRGGYTTQSRRVTTADTNAVNLFNGATIIGSCVWDNPTTTFMHVKVYDKGSPPVIGTDPVICTIGMPATSADSVPLERRLTAGLSIAVTAGALDGDTVAAAAGAVVTIIRS